MKIILFFVLFWCCLSQFDRLKKYKKILKDGEEIVKDGFKKLEDVFLEETLGRLKKMLEMKPEFTTCELNGDIWIALLLRNEIISDDEVKLGKHLKLNEYIECNKLDLDYFRVKDVNIASDISKGGLLSGTTQVDQAIVKLECKADFHDLFTSTIKAKITLNDLSVSVSSQNTGEAISTGCTITTESTNVEIDLDNRYIDLKIKALDKPIRNMLEKELKKEVEDNLEKQLCNIYGELVRNNLQETGTSSMGESIQKEIEKYLEVDELMAFNFTYEKLGLEVSTENSIPHITISTIDFNAASPNEASVLVRFSSAGVPHVMIKSGDDAPMSLKIDVNDISLILRTNSRTKLEGYRKESELVFCDFQVPKQGVVVTPLQEETDPDDVVMVKQLLKRNLGILACEHIHGQIEIFFLPFEEE